MVFGKRDISEYSKSNIAIWLVLAFQGGALNALGLLAGKYIVSHVTGIVTNIGLTVSNGEFRNTAYLFAVPLFFLIGSMVSGYFVE